MRTRAILRHRPIEVINMYDAKRIDNGLSEFRSTDGSERIGSGSSKLI